MAMLHILHSLRERLSLDLHVAHLNHMMRGQDAEEDAAFVRDTCRAMGIPCKVGRVDVPAIAEKEKLSPEEAARKARYEFLFCTAGEIGAEKIAVAHHGDDQAETLIMHLLNGTGTVGLGGIKPKSGRIVRPLLEFRRSEIEEYCRNNGIRFREDISNEDPAFFRNKIRHYLMPILEEYNPNIVEALMRTAEIIQAENDYIETETALAFKKAAKSSENKISVDPLEFEHLHEAVQRRLVRTIYRVVSGGEASLEFIHVEKARRFILSGGTGKKIELPKNILVEKGYQGVSFFERDEEIEDQIMPWSPHSLTVPGVTVIPEICVEIYSEILSAGDVGEKVFSALPEEAYVDWEKIHPPLTVGPRAEGSFFHPLGSAGSKSLKQFFIDVKIPLKERSGIPVISDRRGVVWVAGFRIDERVKVTEATREILRMAIRKRPE